MDLRWRVDLVGDDEDTEKRGERAPPAQLDLARAAVPLQLKSQTRLELSPLSSGCCEATRDLFTILYRELSN